MDATQMISGSIQESDEEENEEGNESKRGQEMAKLCILKNEHIPETELPLFLGENVLGRDPNSCTVPLPSPSISKRHAAISIAVYRRRGCHGEVDIEALVWDLGSMNGTRKGRLKLTPNVRYALNEGDSLVVADIPCVYVSCAAQTVTSQEDFKIPVSRDSGVKARMPETTGEKKVDTSTSSKKRVYGSTEAMMSLPDLEPTRKTPIRTSCLSLEQTPTHPQGTLVPESDSDSDGEREGGADRRHKAAVCDADSYNSSPTCSKFLSPTNIIVPESEDESPITPQVSTDTGLHRPVSLSKVREDIDVGRQHLKKNNSFGLWDDIEEEEDREQGKEEGGAAPGGRMSTESGQDVLVKQGSNVSLTREEELPAFDINSDTDMEEEEEGLPPVVPDSLNTSQPLDMAQFHMDSDTDVDEDDDGALVEGPKTVSTSTDGVKPSHVISVIQPEAITMDSDTDVDDDDEDAVSEAAAKADAVSFQSTSTADPAPVMQPKDFHLDSDINADMEEENVFETINTCFKIQKTSTALNVKPNGPESAPSAPHSLHLDRDTDDEVIPAPLQNIHTTDSVTSTQRKDFHLDSDTDVEMEEQHVYETINTCSEIHKTPPALYNKSDVPGSASAAPHSRQPDSDTDDEVIPAPLQNIHTTDSATSTQRKYFHLDSDTEDEVIPAPLQNIQKADSATSTQRKYFHLDSDTEDEVIPAPLQRIHKADSATSTQRKDFHLDSDTDEEVFPAPLQNIHKADSLTSTQRKDFHLDSDTDVEMEEQHVYETINTCSEIHKTPPAFYNKSAVPGSASAAPHSLKPDSDTDDEVIPAPLQNIHTTDSATSTQRKDFHLDSDTEDEVIPAPLQNIHKADSLTSTQRKDFHLDSDTEDEVIPLPLQNIHKADSATSTQRKYFHLDSDTEDEVIPAPLQNIHKADSLTSTQRKDFHLDSDTDVEMEEQHVYETINTCSEIHKTPPAFYNKSDVPGSASAAPHSLQPDSDTDEEVIPAPLQNIHTTDSATSTQRKDFHLDSDTEDEVIPLPLQRIHKADSATSTQRKYFHLDSDTEDEVIPAPLQRIHKADSLTSMQSKDYRLDVDNDIDEGQENVFETINIGFKIDEPPTRLDIQPTGPGSAPAAPRSLLLDVNVDDDDVPGPAPSEPLLSDVTQSFTTSKTGAEAVQSDSDAETDADESSIPPAGGLLNLCRENTPELSVPILQNCSTPVHFTGAVAPTLNPEGLSSCTHNQEDEDFVIPETQSFLSPSRDHQGNPPEDHTMEATQDFVLEFSCDEDGERYSRGGSDSSNLQALAQNLAMESTQAFVSVEDSLAYAAASKTDTTSPESDLHMEATQAYGENEKQARCSAKSETESQVDLALGETQAYISEPYCLSFDETNEDQRKNMAAAETLDFATSSTQAYVDTQPMSAFVEGECLDEENPVSSVLQVKSRPQSQTQVREEHGGAAEPQERPFSGPLSAAETQLMCASDDEESNDENPISNTQKRNEKPMLLEEEQTQLFTISEVVLAETQPMNIVDGETQPMNIVDGETQPMDVGGNEVKDVETSTPCSRKRKAKQHWQEKDATQTLTNSFLDTQPMDTNEFGKSDEEDSIPGPRKRKAKQLQIEDEQTQSLISPEVSSAETPAEHIVVGETQPMAGRENEKNNEEDSTPGLLKRNAKHCLQEKEGTQTLKNSDLDIQLMDTSEHEENDEEDSIPGPRKRKAKRMHIEDDETKCLISPEVSSVETQPMVMDENRERDEDDSIPVLRKRKAKPLQIQEEETPSLTVSEDSIEAPPLEIKTSLQPQKGERGQSEAGSSGITVRGERDTRAQLRDKEDCFEGSEPSKRRTREKNKALPSSKSRTDVEKSEVQDAKPTKQARGKKSMKKQKDVEEGKETEGHKPAESVTNEQEEGRLAEDDDITEQTETEKREKDEEQLEKQRKEKEEKGRLECERSERDEQGGVGRKEQEEKESIDPAESGPERRLEREVQEHQAKNDDQEKETENKPKEEQQGNKEEEANHSEMPARSRRATRRTSSLYPTELKQNSNTSANEDVPARRSTRRSNSPTSVHSEGSGSSVASQEGRGRGRGRGAKRTSEPPQAVMSRSSNRRRTVATDPSEQNRDDIPPQGLLLRSNSRNSLNSELSSCSLRSQSRGTRGMQNKRGGKTEENSNPPINSQTDQNVFSRPSVRGRGGSKAEDSPCRVPLEKSKDNENSRQGRDPASRGRRRANINAAEAIEKVYQEEEGASEESLQPKSNVRVRGQKAAKREGTVETPVSSAVSDGHEAKETRKQNKGELEANAEGGSSSNYNICQLPEKVQTADAAEREAKCERKDEVSVKTQRKGRSFSIQPTDEKGSQSEIQVKEVKANMGEGTVERRGRGRPSVVQKKKKEEQETPTCSEVQEQQPAADSSPVAKTLRSFSASPGAGGRLRASSLTYKVLFTGVVDEAGEKVLSRLGGKMAKDVEDMNCLVTDKVRRTVKFLCAVARGVPIVTTHWLEKSGKTGSFQCPNDFIVKDSEQERKFNFCLQESLEIASRQPLLQGYHVHVTKSVKPEPVHMRDIVTCSGATSLSKMPSSNKPQTVVISCEEDWPLCVPALSASLPVVSAEFILTGILQQKLDFQAHLLQAPLQPTGGRGRGRKKT